jgi:hypothetical protein
VGAWCVPAVTVVLPFPDCPMLALGMPDRERLTRPPLRPAVRPKRHKPAPLPFLVAYSDGGRCCGVGELAGMTEGVAVCRVMC